MKTALGLIAFLGLATATGAIAADAPTPIGYVTKASTNQGWAIINKGAEDAARDAKVKLVVGGPATRGALEDQIDAIRIVIAQGVKAIALAPVDSKGVVPIVRKAIASGIPVVAVDTAIDDSAVKSYVATDNLAAAAAQAEWVAGKITDSSKIILVNGNLAQSTGRERRQGFLDRLKQLKPGTAIIEVNTSWDIDQARAGSNPP